MKNKKVKIKLIKSPIGYNKKIRDTVRALGLKRPGNIVQKELTPQIEGMIKKVNFMLNIEQE